MNVYDFDGTIYDGDCTIDFYLFALKIKPALLRFVPKQLKGALLYILKQIDKTALKEYFFSFLAGIEVKSLANVFWDKNQHKVCDWYLKQRLPDDVVISASPEFLLKPICDRLGIHSLIASKVDCETGKFLGQNCRGEEKVLRLKREFENIIINNFYSDSVSDLPLAKIAENAFLIKRGSIITKWINE